MVSLELLHLLGDGWFCRKPLYSQGSLRFSDFYVWIGESDVWQVAHAAALSSSVNSIPSLNFTPSITFARCQRSLSLRQESSALTPILYIIVNIVILVTHPFACLDLCWIVAKLDSMTLVVRICVQCSFLFCLTFRHPDVMQTLFGFLLY